MHEVHLERAAQRDLRRLQPSEFGRVIAAIRALANNPRPPGCRKIVGSANDWRVRVGRLRIIYEVDDADRQVRVMRVRHRREAY
ncbi:MAG: type II toxin-antitoxin system RelE/ParE family toxin [Chloroflexi bacterium]|nr:type II toxin-antitoxin system RelE/ParE family toxin [Chloroflexota bacterium]